MQPLGLDFLNRNVYITRMSSSSTADNILLSLKTRGALSAKQIAETFKISTMGAHKALNSLAEQQLVASEDHSRGRGRPTRLFKLTEAGHARFPDNHAGLTVELIRDVQNLFGEAGLDRLISTREERQRAAYAGLKSDTLAGQVAELAQMRTAEGYMARSEAADDGSYLLVEDHCPICAAADACQGFCRSELAVFQAALGEDVSVSREDHLLSGSRRCTYRIRLKDTP